MYRGRAGTPRGDGKELAGEIVDALEKDEYQRLLALVQRLRRRGSDTQVRTALRKLFETVNKYLKDAEASPENTEKNLAKAYASIMWVSGRRKEPFDVIREVAERYLVKGRGEPKKRFENFVLFLELVTAIVGGGER